MSLSIFALRFLSTARVSAGLASLIAPVFTSHMFGIPLPPDAAIITRLFGARDLLLGVYLWRSSSAYIPSSSVNHLKPIDTSNPNETLESTISERLRRRDMEVALGFGLICDAVDVASGIACILEGNLSDQAKIGVLGGAGVLAAIGAWQWRVLQRDI